MKKTLIALAAVAAATGVAFAQSSVTVYGILDTGYETVTTTNAAGVNTAKTAGLKSGSMSGSRIGFRGTEDLGGGLTAGFDLQAGISASDGAIASSDASAAGFGRVAQASLSGSFGRVAIGRNFVPSYLVAIGYDVTGGGTGITITNNYVPLIRNNGFSYSNKFGDIGVNAFVMSGKSGTSAAPNKASGTDISVTYASGPVAAAVGFGNGKSQTVAILADGPAPGDVGTAAADATRSKTGYRVIGASYDLGMAKVMINTSTRKNTDQLTNAITKSAETNIGVSIPLGQVTVMVGVGNDKNTDAANVESKARDTVIGASYALSKRTNVFAFMTTDETPAAAGANNAKTKRTTFGLRHTF